MVIGLLWREANEDWRRRRLGKNTQGREVELEGRVLRMQRDCGNEDR